MCCFFLILAVSGILLDHKTPIPYLQRLRWAKQVAQGLQYLHTRNPRVIHRDIVRKQKCDCVGRVFSRSLSFSAVQKSANILVDELLCTKICDFGLAKRKLLAELPGESNGINLKDSRVMNVSWQKHHSLFAHLLVSGSQRRRSVYDLGRHAGLDRARADCQPILHRES